MSRSPLAALAALLAVVFALSSCGPQRPTQVVKVTQYNGGEGVPLYVSSDAMNLTGAPKDFQTFIQGKVRAAIEDDNGSCDEPPVYTVRTASTNFAAGDFSRCGISHLVWAKTRATWAQVLDYRGDPACADLKEHDVPPGITGDSCRDDQGSRPYKG